MKIEIGGGVYPREGFVNVDVLECADIKHNLNRLPWPFEDGIAEELYSSHCIEHVANSNDFLRECARICKVGARVEIRCPDAFGEMAMCPGHNHVISINVIRHADHVFSHTTWKGTKQRLLLCDDGIEIGCDDYWFPKARANPLFAQWSDEDILTWLPRTRHENRFHFVVAETEPELRDM